MSSTTAAALTAALLSTPAAALPPLTENATIESGFYAIGLADEVQENCDSISPRLFRAYSFLRSLESYAKEAGYTDEDIDALVENRAAKEGLRKRIRADLRERGARPNSPEGYCTVGREEIAKDSMAGRLLRQN